MGWSTPKYPNLPPSPEINSPADVAKAVGGKGCLAIILICMAFFGGLGVMATSFFRYELGEIVANGVEAEAVVLSKNQTQSCQVRKGGSASGAHDRRECHDVYAIKYQFIAQDGKAITDSDSVSAEHYATTRQGERITVSYAANDPETSRMGSLERTQKAYDTWGTARLGALAVCSLGALGLWGFSRKPKQPEQQSSSN